MGTLRRPEGTKPAPTTASAPPAAAEAPPRLLPRPLSASKSGKRRLPPCRAAAFAVVDTAPSTPSRSESSACLRCCRRWRSCNRRLRSSRSCASRSVFEPCNPDSMTCSSATCQRKDFVSPPEAPRSPSRSEARCCCSASSCVSRILSALALAISLRSEELSSSTALMRQLWRRSSSLPNQVGAGSVQRVSSRRSRRVTRAPRGIQLPLANQDWSRFASGDAFPLLL
mmetsp:Transcript_70280/g.201375  ORF Transcript_70280/g.201375 Transcript_70280/m.201375 type:complete len:227 (-) Transcript_70280:163-843(-)